MLAEGEHAYARWGRLAVFVTPAIISGTARMRHGQFIVWNLLASLAFSVSVGASVYGLGRIASGHHTGRDLAVLVVGVGVGTLLVVRARRRHRRRRGRRRWGRRSPRTGPDRRTDRPGSVRGVADVGQDADHRLHLRPRAAVGSGPW